MRRARNRARLASRNRTALLFETLEPRVLLSASPLPALQPLLQDANGTQLYATLSGPGHVSASEGAAGAELTVSGTNASSTLTLTVKGGTGHFVLNGIDLAGPMNSLNGTGIDLQGKFTDSGPIGLVALGDVRDSTFSASGSIGLLTLGRVQNSNISVAGSISNFTLNSWLSTGASNRLSATSIGILNSFGDFDASLALSGPTGPGGAPTLGLAKIGGALADGYWYVVGNTGLVVAGQAASNWTGDFTKSVNFDVVSSQQGLKADFDGTLATPDLKSLMVSGNLNGAQLLLGADIGANGKVGPGTGQYSAGTLESLFVGGSFIGARIWAGVVPGPSGVYDVAGDTFFGNPANDRVQQFFVGGTLDATSKIEAGTFTMPVTVNGKSFIATTDPHFVTHTVGSASLAVSLALLNNPSAISGLTRDPTTSVIFHDGGPVVSLVATLDGLKADSINLLTSSASSGTLTVTPAVFQSLAGGTLKDGTHTLTVVGTDKGGLPLRSGPRARRSQMQHRA